MNRSLIWLGAALFTWGMGEGMFLMFQPIYLQQLGANPIQIGTILGAFGLVMTLAHIPAGHLSDRIGSRSLLIAAWLTGIVATLSMALASTLPAFVAGALLYGATAFVISPLDSYVTAARGQWSVARAITFTSTAFTAGGLFGPVTGGWLADRFDLRIVYFVATAIFVVSTTLVCFIAPQPRAEAISAGRPPALLTNRRYIGVLSVYFVVALATYLPQPLTPNFLNDQRGLSLVRIGELGSIGSLGNAVFTFLLGQLEARLGFLLGQVGVAAFAFLLWRATAFPWFVLAYLLLGGYRALRGLGVAQVRPYVQESQMGLAYGIAETVGAATTLIAPPVAGLLYERDPSLMYPVGLILILAAWLTSFAALPRSRRMPPDHIELAPDL